MNPQLEDSQVHTSEIDDEKKPFPFAPKSLTVPMTAREQQARERKPANSALPKIMVIDDEPINIRVVKKYLQAAGFERFAESCDPISAFDALIRSKPDLLILDINMPEVNGLEILARIREDDDLRFLPVLVLTASSDRETRLTALNLGATDFLSKPVDPCELGPRVQHAIESKLYQDHLRNYNQELTDAVMMRTEELEKSRREVLSSLARAAEYKDDCTGQHVLRVGRYAAMIAKAMNQPSDYIEKIGLAAQLHDVGKIGIQDGILNKSESLTEEEKAQMQRHTGMGRDILQGLVPNQQVLQMHTEIGARILERSESPLLRMAYNIAITHHERWDGTGYPIGLAGTDIPLEGRITAVADVFDALTTKRPYKPAYPIEKSFQIIMEGRGSHFDPDVVDAFMGMRSEIVKVQMDLANIL